MKRAFFSMNIGRKGRWIRGVAAAAVAAGALFCYPSSKWLTLGLGGLALFMAFEALRGWCLLRACGIRTRL